MVKLVTKGKNKRRFFVENNQSLTPIFICIYINVAVANLFILPLIPESYFKNLIDSLILGFFVGLGVYMGDVISKRRNKLARLRGWIFAKISENYSCNFTNLSNFMFTHGNY
jgi:hypothetical protein